MKRSPDNITHYSFAAADCLFLDANVWLYIFSPYDIGGHWEPVYSSAFDRLVKAKSQLFTDVLVISEFINTYARVKWKQSDFAGESFKRFRDSKEFEPVAEEISAHVKKIVAVCLRLESGFADIQTSSLLANYATGKFDFNDQIIAALCRKQRLTLVTNDGDFKSQGVQVLTANQKLLR